MGTEEINKNGLTMAKICLRIDAPNGLPALIAMDSEEDGLQQKLKKVV
jgi:hypothetical protein